MSMKMAFFSDRSKITDFILFFWLWSFTAMAPLRKMCLHSMHTILWYFRRFLLNFLKLELIYNAPSSSVEEEDTFWTPYWMLEKLMPAFPAPSLFPSIFVPFFHLLILCPWCKYHKQVPDRHDGYLANCTHFLSSSSANLSGGAVFLVG